jgi:hypothetical protein
MRLLNTDPTIDISASSGTLRVTVSRRSWLVVFFEGGVILTLVTMTYRSWASMAHMFRLLFVWGIVSGIAAPIFQLSGTEIIEFDSESMTIRKEIHGWERKREYSVRECSELEWTRGAEDTPQRLQCKIGHRTIGFGENLTEDQAIQVLAALQRSLPEVAHQLCSYPGSKTHFITLGLS